MKSKLEAIAETLHYEVYGLGIDTAIIQAGMYVTDLVQRKHRPAMNGRG